MLSSVHQIENVYLCVAPDNNLYNEVINNQLFTRLTKDEIKLSELDKNFIGIIINMNFPKHFRQFAEFTKTVGNLIDKTFGAFVHVISNIMMLKYDKEPRGYIESLDYDVLWFQPNKFSTYSKYGTFGQKELNHLNHLTDLYIEALEMIYGKCNKDAIFQEVINYFSINFKS